MSRARSASILIIVFSLKAVDGVRLPRCGIELLQLALGPSVLWNGGRFTGQEFNPVDLSARLDALYSLGCRLFPDLHE